MDPTKANSADLPGEGSPPETDRQERFTLLFARHVDELKSHIGFLVPLAADADEAFQETSIALWRKFDDFRPDGNFAAWARGVATNVVRNFRRVESRRRIVLLEDDLLEQLAQARQDALPRLSQRHEALRECLERLAPADRLLIGQCYFDGTPIAQLVGELGRSPNAIYKRLAVLRKLLLQCIDQSVAAKEECP